MNNMDIINEFNNVLMKAKDIVEIDTMIAALDEYLKAIPGRKNVMPNYESLLPRYRLPILHLANAILYQGYVAYPLSQEEYAAYHPENCIMADGSHPTRNDFILYLHFLEAAINHLIQKQQRETK